MKNYLQILHWTPRILGILSIAFISLFVQDSFDKNLTFTEQLSHLFMHLIPTLSLLIIYLIACRRELLGGILFTIIGIGFSPIIFIHNFNMNQSVWKSLYVIALITFPFIISGLLFIMNHIKKNKLGYI